LKDATKEEETVEQRQLSKPDEVCAATEVGAGHEAVRGTRVEI
jgi:hypothetical protein